MRDFSDILIERIQSLLKKYGIHESKDLSLRIVDIFFEELRIALDKIEKEP